MNCLLPASVKPDWSLKNIRRRRIKSRAAKKKLAMEFIVNIIFSSNSTIMLMVALSFISIQKINCPKYSIPREKFYNQIQHNFVDFNQLSSTELLIKLMNSQNFSLNSHLLKFVSLCNDFVIICYQITLMTLDWPVLIVTLS